MDETIINNLANKINEKEKSSNKTSSWSGTTNNIRYPTEKLVKDSLDAKSDSTHTHNSQISYGQVDDTSTSTVFTATVPGVTALTDGTTVMLKNGVVTSASGFTLNVNNLGAKAVYNNMAAASADTTIFNVNYTMLFVYDSTRISDGCWICYRGYNSDTNTIGYQLRTNSSVFIASDRGYRYRLWLQCPDGKLMPVNTSTSTNATAKRDSAMNTRKFVLGGKIVYNSTKADYSADATLPANTLWQQYNFTFGYSFNNTGSALTLTPNAPIYMVCTDEGGGLGKLASPYYTQTLPNSIDNKLYIYLGMVTAATTVELGLEHAIFEYRNGAIGLWSNNGHSHTTSQITDFPSTMTPSSHAHGNLQNDGSVGTSNNASKNVVTDSNGKITTEAKPTIPSNTSELTNDSGFLTSHQDISGKLDKAQTSYKGKNVVVDSTSGNITFEDKNNHTHSQYLTSHQSLANYVTTDDSRLSDSRTPTSHTHGNLQNNGQVGSTAQANKNVVTNSSGLITTEDKPTIPSASSTTPSADTTNGSVGNGTTWARSNHTHPKSSLYAEASHTHTKSEVTDFPTLHTVATSGSYNDLSDKPNIPESSTVDTTLSGTSNNAIANSTVKNALDNKLDKTHTSYKGKNVVTNGSTGAIEFEEKNNHTHSQYLTEHQSLTNYVQKNNTNGLLKNDGTVDTTSYSTFNGNYNDLTNKPTIPTKTSDLTNDSGFLTSHQDISGKEDTSNKVVSLSSSSTDTQYPSAKIVYDSLNDLHTSNIKIGNEPLTNIWTGTTITDQAALNILLNTHIGEIDARLQKEEIVYGSIYKTDSSRVYITGTYNKVCESINSQHPLLNEMIFFKLPNDLNSSSTKSIRIKVIYYVNSYSSSTNNYELPVKYNNVAIKENTFISNTIILLKLNNSNNGFDVIGVFSPNSTGSYTDLTNKPTIPSKTSDLTNDSGFLTSHQSLANYVQKSSTTGLLQNDGTVNTTLIQSVNDIGQTLTGLSDVASSGDYSDLTNKPSYTPTVTSSTSGAYEIGTINISGNDVTIYGKDTDTHQTLKTINNESLIGTGNITIENEEIEYLNGNFSGDSSYFIIASSTKSSVDNGDRFYIHISNTSTSTSNTRLTISYGSGSYYASGDIYDKSYNRIPSNQININTILLVECVADNGYSWNIIEAFNGDINNSHTHSQYLTSSDISGKIDTAGTGLSKNGTTLNHSNSIEANSTPSLAKYSYDAQGHITGRSGIQASDILTILGLSFYRYELTSDDYNPAVSTTNENTYTITCKCTDIFGSPIDGKQLTLYKNGSSVSNATTDTNGIATWTEYSTTWGIQDYSVSNIHCQVNVGNWKHIAGSSSGTWQILRNHDHAKLILRGWTTTSTVGTSSWNNFGSSAYASSCRPSQYRTFLNSGATLYWRINTDGTIEYRSTSGTVASGTSVYTEIEWAIRDTDL